MNPSIYDPSGGSAAAPGTAAGTRTEASTTHARPIRSGAESLRSESTIPSTRPPLAKHVRYTVTEADSPQHQVRASLVSHQVKFYAETGRYDVRSKGEEIGVSAARCSDLLNRMLETEDLIERENIYRTFDVSLARLFELRTSWERPFGHLVTLLLGITKHTSSESFTNGQLTALKRAVALMHQPRIVDADLQEARRLLSRAGFDLFRPLRGVFEDV